MKRLRGFTLIELLVALTVFAILSTIAYGGLRSVLNAREQTEKHSRRLTEIETAMSFLSRDLVQAIDRPVRDEYGGLKASFQGGAGSMFPFELTREGHGNPANQVRSHLQRVAYGVSENTLVRHSWRVLDRAQDSLPLDTRLLTGVTSVKARFLSAGRQWVEDWPPPSMGAGVGSTVPAAGSPAVPFGNVPVPPATAGLPLAVEVTLELAQEGTVGRIFRLPGGN